MKNTSVHKGLMALATAVMMSSAAYGTDYILDDFENTDYGSDVMNYSNGAWYLYDDNAPSWNKTTYDPVANKYNDAEPTYPWKKGSFLKIIDASMQPSDHMSRL